MKANYRILEGDVVETLKDVPSASVQCCVTSPPYFGLRDYGTGKWEGGDIDCSHNPQKPDGGERENRTLPLGRGGVYRDVCGICGAVRIDNQVGLEKTPEEYIERLVNVFREVKRVLRDDGTLWINIGDSYAGSNGNGYKQTINNVNRTTGTAGNVDLRKQNKRKDNGCKPKDLIGIPWMLAFALRADGWYLRQDIIWHKPNPMPESVKDRCTRAHEYIFLLSKSQKYYYDADAIKEPSVTYKTDKRTAETQTEKTKEFRNKRDVWTVTTKPYKGAHFAVFPPDLIEPCILAGSRIGDIVLDPFSGSGTTGEVANKYGRKYVGCELNPDYVELSLTRLSKVR